MYTLEYTLQSPATLHCSTFLSPILFKTYTYITRYIGAKLDRPTTLSVGYVGHEATGEDVNIAFMCGLLYIRMAQQPSCPVEPLVAPIVYGARYRDKPLYFSDVVVRNTSPYRSFNDLRECVWAYNERASHSGWNLVRYHLYERGATPHFFAQLRESGSHLQSLHMVLAGQADATAIDSHVLDVLHQQQPELATQLRVISSLGPTTIPPLVVAKKMDADLKADIQAVLLNMHHDPHAQAALRTGLIKRFVPVQDENYDDIRYMFAVVQEQQAI